MEKEAEWQLVHLSAGSVRQLDELCSHNGITSVEAQNYAWAADLESWEIPADGKKGGGKDSNGCSKGSK